MWQRDTIIGIFGAVTEDWGPQIPGRDSQRGLHLPAVPDEGWLQSHPRDPNQWGPADDGDDGGAKTKVLVL